MSEVINIIVGMLTCTQAKHRHLLKWVPSLHLYFPLGSVAAYKGFLELLYKPFYWDKTGSWDIAGHRPDAAPYQA